MAENKILFNRLLAYFGESLGLTGLTLDQNGICSILINDLFEINLAYDEESDHLILFTNLGEPEDESPEVYENLLEANLFWKDTEGGTICLDSESGDVLLVLIMRIAGIDEDSFKKTVSAFSEGAERWIELIDETDEPEDENFFNPPDPNVSDLLSQSR